MDKHYIKDLKKAYRILRKEKNEYEKGDEKRIELNSKMKEIKQKIKESEGGMEIDPQKQALIDKIVEFKTKNKIMICEMSKFSLSELEFHYMKITGQVKTKEEYNKLKGIVLTTPSSEAAHPFLKKGPDLEEISAAHSPIEAGIRRIKRKDVF